MRHWSAPLIATCLCVVSAPVLAQDASSPLLASPAPRVAAPGPTSPGEPASGLFAPAIEDRSPLLTARPKMPTVGSLFTGLKQDFRATATTDNAIIMVGAGAAASLIHPYDNRISDALASSSGASSFLSAGSVIGGMGVQFGGSWAVYGLGRAFKSERVAVVGADLVRAQMVAMVYTQGLKLSINRTRPDGDAWSFPSGHTSSSFATAAVLQRHFGWKAGMPAFAMATYVAASRVQERRHFASDVIFGAGIGLISGRAVTIGRGSHRFAVSPMGLPGGAGISFTRLAN